MIDLFIYRQALADFLRPRRIVAWVVVAIALFFVTHIFQFVNPDADHRDAYTMMSAVLVFRLLPLASAIFSTAVLSSEVEQRTIVYLLTRPIERWRLLLMRALASMTAVFFISALAAASVSLAVYGLSGNPYFGRDVVALAVGSAAYGGLFVAFSLLVNRAMIVCLLYAFAWETSIPNMPGNLHYLSITSYLHAIAQRPSTGAPSGPLDVLGGSFGFNLISPGTGWIVMLCLIAVTIGFGLYWFTTNEYLPREDAE
jgi:ABC-2 type transport system permease protein